MKNGSSKKYLTLKEAAAISGYAPDYIGQLIRKGKLSGKQVYHNVAWMTTEKDLREYMRDKKGVKKSRFRLKPESLFKTALYSTIVLATLFSFVLFYIFSVSMDKKIEERAIENIQLSQQR